MSLTFNIADLHGRSDLAAKAVDYIHNYQVEKFPGVDYKIVFTGDYIDRGPDSRGVIEFIKDLQDHAPDMIIALKGNHETFMLDAYAGKGIDFWVTFNGGDATYMSYGMKKPGPFPEEHIKWVNELPLYYDDGKRLYVHAGISDYSIPLNDQKEDDLVWYLYDNEPSKLSRDPDGLTDSPPYDINGKEGGYGSISERHVVHGHHQFKDGPKLFTNRSNFDTLAWWTGRLVVGVFDNDKVGGPIDTIEVKGDPISLIRSNERISRAGY